MSLLAPSEERSVDIVRVDARAGPELSRLTFPRFAPLLQHKWSPNVIAIAARSNDSEAIGLALGVQQRRRARLLSCYVAPDQRGRGLARRLVSAFCRAALSAGALATEAQIATGGKDLGLVFDRTAWLQAGWTHDRIDDQIIVNDTINRLLLALPPLRGHDAIAQAISIRPLDTRPAEFDHPATVEPGHYLPRANDHKPAIGELCFSYYRNGQKVGWAVPHKMDASWVRLTCMYFSPDLKPSECSFLIRHFLLTAQSAGWERLSFATSAVFPGFMRFCERRATALGLKWSQQSRFRLSACD